MKVAFLFLLLLNASQSFSQNKSGVRLLARVKGKSIMLRWAPDAPAVWELGNKQGYVVERYTFNEKLENVHSTKKVLSPLPVKPKGEKEWSEEIDKNDFSAVAAQCIFGSSLEIKKTGGGIGEIIKRSQELEQRFSFALFAADQSFQTALLSGLAWQDDQVKENENYLYRVFVIHKNPKLKLDTGIYFIGLRDTLALTPPQEVTALFGDKEVLLRWPKTFVEKQYSGYIVERSEGGEFVRRNKTPILNTSGDEVSYFQAVDSLPQNGIRYNYRIRGITPFGEIGPASKEVSGMGIKELAVHAAITEIKNAGEQASISWQLKGNLAEVETVWVERSEDTKKPFQPIHTEALTKETLSFTDKSPLLSNYYRIKLIGKNEQAAVSWPVLFQLADSIPPAKPQGLVVAIDTLGLVKLSWTPNREGDLAGYRIFRSNFKSAEFTQVNSKLLEREIFIDTVNVKTLSKNIFYSVAAYDKRYNRSEQSEIATIELPDVIPPQPPVLVAVSVVAQGIELKWENSSSEDVAEILLQRFSNDNPDWIQLKSFSSGDQLTYTDKNTKPSFRYEYRLLAKDKAGHVSKPSSSFAVKTGAIADFIIADFKGETSLEGNKIVLRWKCDKTTIAKIMLYKSENEGPLQLYKSINGTAQNFEDNKVTNGNKYTYCVKGVMDNGVESKWSEKIIIQLNR